eukprot:scaffold11779_cov39-Cyclotella_meneghiniana.AAC.1
MVPSWSNVHFRNCAAPLWLGEGRKGPALRLPRGHYDLKLCLTLEIGRSRGLRRGDTRLGGAYLAKVSRVGIRFSMAPPIGDGDGVLEDGGGSSGCHCVRK